jgi:hypothetical protein
MPRIFLIVAALGAIGWSFSAATAESSQKTQYAQNNTCYTNCANQRATCDRGCNAGGGSMLHVQACLVGCENGQAGCAARCR